MSIYEYDEERNLEDHYKEGMKLGERLGGIRTLIEISEEDGVSEKKICSQLKNHFSLDDTEIQKAMRKYSRRHG